jgi:hypothetical protein
MWPHFLIKVADANVIGCRGVCGPHQLQQLWEAVGDKIYSLEDGKREFGFSPAGCSAYYSPGESASDTVFVTQ